MQIRRVQRGKASAQAPKPIRERVRQWAQTSTGCRGCDKVRAAALRLMGERKPK